MNYHHQSSSSTIIMHHHHHNHPPHHPSNFGSFVDDDDDSCQCELASLHSSETTFPRQLHQEEPRIDPNKASNKIFFPELSHTLRSSSYYHHSSSQTSLQSSAVLLLTIINIRIIIIAGCSQFSPNQIIDCSKLT